MRFHRHPGLPTAACLLSILVLIPSALGAGPEPKDPLVEALAAAGLSPGELGFAPRSTWLRYPDPAQIPYLNRTFNDLMANPGRLDDTLRLMGRAAGDFLGAEYRAKKADGLFRAAYFTGWDLRLSGHRDFDAGLNETLPEGPGAENPLVFAVERLYRDRGVPFDLFSLDKPADFPLRRADTRKAAEALDPQLQRIAAQAVLDLADALRWHRLAFRRADRGQVIDAFYLRDLTATQFDGMEYFPEMDDLALTIDEAALNTSARKVVEAGERLQQALAAWAGTTTADLSAQAFDLVTPGGRLVVAGAGAQVHDERDVLLLIDLGGDDTYTGTAGATGSPMQGVSLAVDLAGNDQYTAADPRIPAQGCGIFGTGVLIDASGNDLYQARFSAQGFGMFGTGLLADLKGDDRYELEAEGQGAAAFGVGLLFDLEGKDSYYLVSAGQGFGGVGNGIGTLVDLQGNDRYLAEPESAKNFRPDYHSQGKLNYSYAQGAAAGRRGDLMDGHSWAGGIGTLIDLDGDDEYTSANWSLGSGYWYGIGWLYDAAGNDRYTAAVFSIASGAHFCIGALLDEKGDDRYSGMGDSHTGMGFGHDFTVALLYDAAGNDEYRFGADGFGFAANMSLGLFVEGGGDDRYTFDQGKNGFGFTNFSPGDLKPVVTRNYLADPVQVGLFLDAGGKDRYLDRDPATGAETPSKELRDGAVKLRPADPRRETEGRHAGIFCDRQGKGEAIEWLAPRWSAGAP